MDGSAGGGGGGGGGGGWPDGARHQIDRLGPPINCVTIYHIRLFPFDHFILNNLNLLNNLTFTYFTIHNTMHNIIQYKSKK